MINDAHEKLLTEMNENDNPAIENIHVYLNQSIDDHLAIKILNEEKTIQEAFKYVFYKAKKQANGSASVMVPKETVYEWVKEFYLNDDIKVKKATKEVKKKATDKKATSSVQQSKKTSKVKDNEYEQISLFSLY